MHSKVQHVLTNVKRIPGKKNFHSKHVFIQCPSPQHNDKTPSCKVNLDVHNRKAGIGSFYCFGCGAKGSYNDLAELLGLAKYSGDHVEVVDLGDDTKTKLLGIEEESPSLKKMLRKNKMKYLRDVKRNDSWRGVKGDFLRALGSVYAENEKGTVFIIHPVYVYGNLVGYVKSFIKRPSNKDIPAHIVSPGEWGREKGLLCFDIATRVMKRKKLKSLVLVEGVRDAMALNIKGIPAVALMGTQSWSSAKQDLLFSIPGLERVVLCLDGDPAGKKATLGYKVTKDGEEVRKPGLLEKMEADTEVETVNMQLYKYAEALTKKKRASGKIGKQDRVKLDPAEMPKALYDKLRSLLV